MKESDVIRFFSKVEKTDSCWIWKAKARCNGYGLFKINQRNIPAHRISYQIHNGDFDFNLHVLHKCDIRNCVNPDHLFLGTNKDNVDDKVSKDRQAKGSDNGNSILSENDVIEIKELLKYKYYGYIRHMMKKYNVSERCILDIKSGRTWKHI
jgi:hypothetical protein